LSDRSGIQTVKTATLDACEKIFDDNPLQDPWMGEPLRTRMQNNLKMKGVNIRCVENDDASGDGEPDCGAAPLGGNTVIISALGTDTCPNLAKTIRHEMQHGAGGQNHVYEVDGRTLNCANDPVFACDVACYDFVDSCPGAQAVNCR
jgi:hypothetical protein